MNREVFKNWTYTRILYIVMGLVFVYPAIKYQDWLVGIVGAFFIFKAVFSIGCASGSCSTDY